MIDIEQMPGPMVLWFDGEGRDCLLCDGPTQVIDYLMDEEGAGWSLDGTKDELLQCLNDEDNWTHNEAGQPFQVTIPIGEISTANVLVKCRKADPIPSGVSYREDVDNFYMDNTRAGMGLDFYRKWKSRSAEFPKREPNW